MVDTFGKLQGFFCLFVFAVACVPNILRAKMYVTGIILVLLLLNILQWIGEMIITGGTIRKGGTKKTKLN